MLATLHEWLRYLKPKIQTLAQRPLENDEASPKKSPKKCYLGSGDENFSASSEEPSDDSDNTEKNSDVMEITNEEVHKSTSL